MLKFKYKFLSDLYFLKFQFRDLDVGYLTTLTSKGYS